MAESPAELQAEIEKLERKHVENPEGRYFVPLANAYRKLGDIENAEELLREGLRRHPEYLSAHIVLGRCYADRNASRQAIDEFRYVLTLDPQNLIALRTLGELALAAGDREEAARWYHELLSVDPMNEEARRALQSLEVEPAAPAEAAAPDPGWEPFGVDPGAPEAMGELSRSPRAPSEAFAAAGGDDDDDDDDAPDAEGIEVVTETIAELYARQGLHDRAIEVYRELIRRRGGDAALEQRLREVEEAREMERTGASFSPAASSAPPSEEASVGDDDTAPETTAEDTSWLDGIVPDPLPDDALAEPVRIDLEAAFPAETLSPMDRAEETADPFADSFAEGFRTGEDDRADAGAFAAPAGFETSFDMGDAEVEHAPAPGFGAGTAAAGPPGIVDELAALASWRPSGDSGGAAAYESATPEEEPSFDLPELSSEPWPDDADTAEAAPSSTQVGMGSADEELFPWELGEPVAEAPEAQAAPEPQAEVDRDFDPFAFEGFREESGSGSVSTTAAGGPGEGETPPLETPDEATGATGSTAEGEGDDDDLESFQAWLRSLKR